MDTFGYDRILVPTDMSEFAKLAVLYAVLFQERLGAALTLMYADEFYFPVDLLELPMGYYLENAPETKKKLSEQLRDYAKAGIPMGAEALIVQDAPARAIVSTAKDMGADLIIMGTHGRRGWRRALLGSVTESVLRDTDTPVLTVTPSLMKDEPPKIRTILCPVNFTRPPAELCQSARSTERRSVDNCSRPGPPGSGRRPAWRARSRSGWPPCRRTPGSARCAGHR